MVSVLPDLMLLAAMTVHASKKGTIGCDLHQIPCSFPGCDVGADPFRSLRRG